MCVANMTLLESPGCSLWACQRSTEETLTMMMMMSDSHLPPFGLRWTNIFQRLNNHFSLKAPSHTGDRSRLNKETCWTFKPQITKLRLVHNTMKQMQDSRTELGTRAGGLITQEVRFLLSNGLHREKSQAGICKPRFNTERAAVLKCFKLE